MSSSIHKPTPLMGSSHRHLFPSLVHLTEWLAVFLMTHYVLLMFCDFVNKLVLVCLPSQCLIAFCSLRLRSHVSARLLTSLCTQVIQLQISNLESKAGGCKVAWNCTSLESNEYSSAIPIDGKHICILKCRMKDFNSYIHWNNHRHLNTSFGVRRTFCAWKLILQHLSRWFIS